MWVVFVDDSKEQSPRLDGLDDLVGFAAVLMPEAALNGYATGVTVLRETLGVPPEVELKWSPKGKRSNWLRSREGAAIRTRLGQGMLRLANDLGARTVAVVCDVRQTDWTREQAERSLLDWLYERIEKCLARHGERGIVIADEPAQDRGGREARERWLAEALQLTDNGTKYVHPDRVVLPVITAPSHHLHHIQLADLIAGATVAATHGNPYGRALMPLLQPLWHTDRNGVFAAAGLKLWPPELTNLYLHAFGEQNFQHATWGRGRALPDPQLPFEQGFVADL